MPRNLCHQLPRLKPTEPEIYFNRRHFISALGSGLVAAPLATTFTRAAGQPEPGGPLTVPLQRPDLFPAARNPDFPLPTEVGNTLTNRNSAARHNNFYEFLPGRGGPAWRYTADFRVEPWKLEISGLCNRPGTLDLDALFKFEHEERTYHFRCVERWAMNIPWSGFPLSKLIEKAEPKSDARFVQFETAKIPNQMPGIRKAPQYPWPYHEALRMDEAMNPLAMVVTGVYGQPLLKQHGAPVRIIVPWKYGYKSPKSIVKIKFLSEQPGTFWQIQPHEYGFLSNVNPNIPHPRWSQARSYWLDSQDWFETPIFNGYDKFVDALYPDEPRTLQKALRSGQIAR